ncbi:MAG: hypothetical protein NC122_04810 [Faecalibacterium sp.]|nr:hypothetical protein [Ruminococcus sp.]MCM1391518.1 hypothetical protein [Ruminococcus sp.]MCM1485506.1 hypothetical protein [Faecalibacterium sp.]
MRCLLYFFKKILSDITAECRISDEAVESIAKCMLDDIAAFFVTEEGREEFEEWQKVQAELKATV